MPSGQRSLPPVGVHVASFRGKGAPVVVPRRPLPIASGRACPPLCRRRASAPTQVLDGQPLGILCEVPRSRPCLERPRSAPAGMNAREAEHRTPSSRRTRTGRRTCSSSRATSHFDHEVPLGLEIIFHFLRQGHATGAAPPSAHARGADEVRATSLRDAARDWSGGKMLTCDRPRHRRRPHQRRMRRW